jgi:hypothetical protein
MLESDLRDSELVTQETFLSKKLPEKIMERVTNLLAPVL